MKRFKIGQTLEAKRPTHGPCSRALAIGGLALLAVVAILLSILAVNAQRYGVEPVELAPPPVFIEEEPVEEEPVEEEPEPEPAPASVTPPTRLLSAGAEPGQLMRATMGECGATPGSVQVSFDGGAEWTEASLANLTGTTIRQIDASDATLSRLAFLDTDCQPQLAHSFIGGIDWAVTPDVGAIWYLNEIPSKSAWTPTGVVDLPCTAVSLVGSNARAVALCEDEGVTMSEDSGATWSPPVRVPGAVAAGLNAEGYVIAAANRDECNGVQTQSFAAGTLDTLGACVEMSVTSDIAVSGGSGAQYLWTGDRFLSSNDGGESWL